MDSFFEPLFQYSQRADRDKVIHTHDQLPLMDLKEEIIRVVTTLLGLKVFVRPGLEMFFTTCASYSFFWILQYFSNTDLENIK